MADSAVQTDWSGGEGTPGPVSSWGIDFDSDSGTESHATPGELMIGMGWCVTTVEWVSTSGFGAVKSIVTGDMDCDGDLDVVASASNYSGLDIAWFENLDGAGTQWLLRPVEYEFNDAWQVSVADIDGDGDPDIAGAGSWDNEMAWWENSQSGEVWTKHGIAAGFNEPRATCTADMDGDGDIDIIGTSWLYTHNVRFWRNLGSGESWEEVPVSSSLEVYCIHPVDANADGAMDLCYSSWYGGQIGWIENIDGYGSSWTTHPLPEFVDHASGVFPGDLDGDGIEDLIGASGEDYDVFVWLNSAAQPGQDWTRLTLDSSFLGAYGVHAADLDQDSDLDLMAAARYQDILAWWENDGTGTGWTKHVVDQPMDGAQYCWAGDFDGDGRPDPLGGSEISNDIAWWRVVDDALEADLTSSILGTGETPEWGFVDWVCDVPPGCFLGLQVRSLDDNLQGTWSDTLTAPTSLFALVEDGDSNFQYRVVMSRPDTTVTPELHEVTVDWDAQGVQDGADPEVFQLDLASSNPVAGPVALQLGLPCTELVELGVFDISGRLVLCMPPVEYQPGWHVVQLDELGPGVFFVRIRAGETVVSRRFVVIE